MTIKRRAIALLVPLMLTAPAPAQTTTQTAPVRGLESLQPQANAQAPAATTPIPIPASPTIVLPTTRSTQAPATQRERAEPRATPGTEPRAATSTPDRATPRPVETVRPSTPAVAPAPVPTPARVSTPSPTVTPSVAPAPVAKPATQPAATATAPETGRAMPLWLWLLVIVVVLAALWALRRPRPERPVEPVFESEPTAPEPEPVAPIVAAPPAPRFLEPRAAAPVQAPRARLAVELRPLRAGLNLLSATTECELVVTNIGDAPADRIRVAVALLTAHAGQDADLVAFNESPIGRAVAPPFALAPGETRSVRTVAAIPRDAIRTMSAAGRPMFVPILAANLLYATGDSDGQTARAWAIGIERVDSAKLAPFWLDAPAKMYDAVAARPHAAALER